MIADFIQFLKLLRISLTLELLGTNFGSTNLWKMFVLIGWMSLRSLSKGVEIIYGLPTYAYVVFSLPLWIIGLTVVLCYHLILLYKNNRTISYWKKGGFTLVLLCLVACIFQWNYWNFIGFNF